MADSGISPDGSGSTASPRDKLFSKFFDERDLQAILRLFRELCEEISVNPDQYEGFYEGFKASFTSWKVQGLFQLFDGRAKQTEYCNQRACAGKRVLVIGAGPVGLRAAIEAAFLGAKVDLVEKRTTFNRNNSLHLWPFLINDLKVLGAKKFYGRFCSSTIDHISIKILQSILLRTCLILGVKVHIGTVFENLVEPKNKNSSWTVKTTPTSCPVTSYDFDMIIGADGKQNSLPGFHSKEFRAKLALAITVNFVNSFTKHEAAVPEISGVAFVYRQEFFKDLATKHGIDLENIVYYNDETHYFVMTAKKASLMNKKVIKKDHNDPSELLAKGNIDKKALEQYAREATSYATEGQLKDLKFEQNHRGENDVALFDFTSLFASENAAIVKERKGKRILLCLVGDSLVEPFWPTGTGCARGFLGVFDAAWMMKRFCAGDDPLEILEERESILYLLPQTTPERLQKTHAAYTIDPKTRYLYLGEAVVPDDISHLYDTDDTNAFQVSKNQSVARNSMKMKHKVSGPSQGARPVQSKSPPKEDTPVPLAVPPPHLSTKRDERQTRSASPPSVTSGQTSAKTSGIKSGQEKQASSSGWRSVFRKKKSESPEDLLATEEKVKETQNYSKQQTKTEAASIEGRTEGKEDKPQSNVLHQIKCYNDKDSAIKPEKKLATAKVRDKRETRSASPVAMKSPTRGSEAKPGREDTKATSPSRWSVIRSKFRRSRSVSPEGVKEKQKKSSKGQDNTKHPLETATSVKSREDVGEEESKSKVSDHIKQYNRRDESVMDTHARKNDSKIDKAEAIVLDSSSTPEKESGKSKGKFKAKAKDKGKKKKEEKVDKEAEEKQSKKAVKKESRWGIFKKPHKGKEQVTESDGVDQLDSPDGRGAFGVESSLVDKLREQELASASGAGNVELLSVAQKSEKLDNDNPHAASPGGASSSGVPDGVDDTDFGGPGPEIRPSSSGHVLSGEVVSAGSSAGHEPVKHSTSVRDKVKKIQVTTEMPSPSILRSMSLSTPMRSKEIDLSDLRGRSQAPPSDPLWKVKVIQGLNKCLERLRKENDIHVAKTAFEILVAIFKNVEDYPNNDEFRRVRVSSKLFQIKVWNHSETKQFLTRSGWAQIDDFIVLPMDTAVELPLKALNKHLNIVNQMLWSRQLDITDSPATVIRRVQANKKARAKPVPLSRRDSYATILVEERMEKISQEEDKRAVEAAHVRRNTADASISRRSQSPPASIEKKKTEEPIVEEDTMKNNTDQNQSRKQEEMQTIKAATEARKIWESMDDEKRVMSIEEQLYGRKKEESITEGCQYVKSSYRRDSASGDVEGKIKMFGANSSRSFSNSSLKTAALSDWVVVEETEDAIAEDEQEVGMETDKTKGSIDGEGNTNEQHVSSHPEVNGTSETPSIQDASILQKLGITATVSSSKTNFSTVSSETPMANQISSKPETLGNNDESESSKKPSSVEEKEDQSFASAVEVNVHEFSSSDNHSAADRTSSTTSEVASDEHSKEEEEELKTSPQQLTSSVSKPECTFNGVPDETTTPLSMSASDQQLKLLTQASRAASVKKEETSSSTTDKSDKIEYEKLTMEAAALTREKWQQAQTSID